MKRTMHCFLLASAVAFIESMGVRSDAANPVIAKSADSSEVRKTLLEETRDDAVSVNRRAALRQATVHETVSNATWWQSGFVKSGNTWKEVEQTHHDAPTQLLDEYRQQRAAAAQTADGQWQLAKWCGSHNLRDQETAHLMQVLALSKPGTNLAPVYKQMGYRQVGEQWFSPVDLQSMKIQAIRSEELQRRWGAKLARIANNWDANAKLRNQSQKELDAIEDVAVLQALTMASLNNESLSMAICKRASEMTSFEASQLLASISVRSDLPGVRQSAIGFLKGRRIDDFAQMLLNMMRSPYLTSKQDAVFGEERLFFREEEDRYVSISFDVQMDSITLTYSNQQGRFVGWHTDRTPTLTQRSQTDRSRLIDDVDHAFQLKLDQENDFTELCNDRAAKVLAEISGQAPSKDPRYWWGWWNIYTATVPKPKYVTYIKKAVALPGKTIQINRVSCLIAGTPIWTERGFVPVEQIQIGDRVLSKDIETGELDYKPVLHTTERQPVPVKRFIVRGTPIVASDGHHFWSSGTGWRKTRELKENLPIHTVTGMSRVESFESQPEPQPVYNLVVADFHTYFIGEAMILSHDVTPPAPTNVKVPGLSGDAP